MAKQAQPAPRRAQPGGSRPCIAPGLLAVTVQIASTSASGMKGWLTRRQGWFFFPLLALEGLNLHVSGIRTLLASGGSPHRRAELLIIVARLSAYVVVLLVLLPPGKAAAFIGVQLAVFGVYLGSASRPTTSGCRSSRRTPVSTSSSRRC